MHSLTITWLPAEKRRPRWLQTLRQWHHARCVMNALEALNDATLKDIGIDRGEIAGIAQRVARVDQPL